MTPRYVVELIEDAAEKGWNLDGYEHREWSYALFDTATNPPRLVYADGGEPEDQRLYRDLKPLVELLNAAEAEARAKAIEETWRAAAAMIEEMRIDERRGSRESLALIEAGRNCVAEAIKVKRALAAAPEKKP